MEGFFDFFVDPLIFPVYVGLALYGFAWLGGRFFAGIFARQLGTQGSAIERGTIRAWRLMVILHLLFETIFVVGLSIHTLPRVADSIHILFYLISYVPFLIIDVCLLISLASHSTRNRNREEQ